ncbi:MAG: hypothetical protein M0Z99_00365 [Betaproteobacteria bacterium]|nr:hypothetical protein [Betaproteobacteria bacterium]
MKRWLLSLLVLLVLCGGAWAEDGGSTGGVRKLGPEESKELLKDVGIVIKDKPTYPDVAYRLYPKPYQVFELATVGYSPFRTEDDSPLNGANPDDAKAWGPDGEPVVILRKSGAGMWMEGFFSRKRVEVDIDPPTYRGHPQYRYGRIPSDRNNQKEASIPDVETVLPKDMYEFNWEFFISPRPGSGLALSDTWLADIVTSSDKNDDIDKLFKEIDTLPTLLQKRGDLRLGKRGWEMKYQNAWIRGKRMDCEPLKWFIARKTTRDANRWTYGNPFWAKTVVRYYPPGKSIPIEEMEIGCKPNPLISWTQSPFWNYPDDPNLLPDGTVLVKVGAYTVIRLRWEDGEPVAPLPPFIKVIDAREVIWAKLDLLHRYRDEMKRRGIKDATKLRTPTQIMHDLAAYFFDIQAIRNWKGDDK